MILLETVNGFQQFFEFLNETSGERVVGYLIFLLMSFFIASVTISQVVESIANIFNKNNEEEE